MNHYLIDINTGQKYELSQGKTNIGRQGQDVNIDDSKVSSHHLNLHVNGDQVKLEEKGSKNGTYINGKKILTTALIELSNKDQIRIGSTNLEIIIQPTKSPEDEIKTRTSVGNQTKDLDKPLSARMNSKELSNFEFVGGGGALFRIILTNFLRTIITLGLYAPFAKTELRKYFWSHSKLEGEAFHFFGTGMELFKAYLKVGILYIVVLFLVEMLASINPIAGQVFRILPVIFYIFLYTRAKYGAHRYLMNRTSYRNINFYMDKEGSWKYTLEILKGAFLCIITLFLYYPYLLRKLDHIKWNNSRFGDLPFKYTAEGSEYFKVFIKGWLLTFITLGLYLPFFMASFHKLQVSHIQVGNARFRSSVNGVGLFKLFVIEFFLIMITFGIALPWVIALNARYYLKNLEMVGSIDIDNLGQAPKVSEGAFMDQMVDFFDADSI